MNNSNKSNEFKLQPMPDLFSRKNSSPSDADFAPADESRCCKCGIAFADADELRLHT